jgi:hypothetical protein
MKTKIGQNLVSSIDPRLSPYEICDTELRGFRIRVQPSGVISFICTYRTRGGTAAPQGSIGMGEIPRCDNLTNLCNLFKQIIKKEDLSFSQK